MQVLLSKKQVQSFYHDYFVCDQVATFKDLSEHYLKDITQIIDIGGGCGFFARKLKECVEVQVTVIDTDANSILTCKNNGLDACLSSALNSEIFQSNSIVCFNLILHHLVGKSDSDTTDMQSRALKIWCSDDVKIFVQEYIYESYLYRGFSALLIWVITSNKILSLVCKGISYIIPSLRANTFGVGVRFRTKDRWIEIFQSSGLQVIGYKKGIEGKLSFARRLLFIKSCRRDSFLLHKRTSL